MIRHICRVQGSRRLIDGRGCEDASSTLRRPLPAPASPADGDRVSLDELADFLNSSSAPPGCMDLSELDGFLAGLLAGPEVISPGEWLPEVWDNEEPDYADEEEQAAVEQAVLDRYASIEAGLDATPLGYSQSFGRTRPERRSPRTGRPDSCRPSACGSNCGNRR